MSKTAKKTENEAVAAAVVEYLEVARGSGSTGAVHLTGGGAIASLENRLAAFFSVKHALCVSSATAGLFVLGLALDLRKGHFVTTPMTFGGSVASWLLLGLNPDFADIDPHTLTLCPDAVRARINEDTRAILAVDTFGIPCDTVSLRKIADEFGLFYVADCAQSLGAKFKGMPTNRLADALVVSFGPQKPLSAAEGGAILTDDTELYEKLIWFSQHPFRQQKELGLGLANEFGFNGRINPLAAILANTVFDSSIVELRNHQDYCLRVINALNGIGLTVQLEFAAQQIEPTFFRLTAEHGENVDPLAVERELEKCGFDLSVNKYRFDLLYQQGAFEAQYPTMARNANYCLNAERQAMNRFCLMKRK